MGRVYNNAEYYRTLIATAHRAAKDASTEEDRNEYLKPVAEWTKLAQRQLSTRAIKCPDCNGTGRRKQNLSTLGEIIWLLRKTNEMSQHDLAKPVGISREQISNIERGKCDPPLGTLVRIAAALGCSIRDLIPD